jgi:hypothetical protein
MLLRLVSRFPATAAEGGCMTPLNLMLSNSYSSSFADCRSAPTIGDRFETDPNLEASQLFERGVILAPVAD